jgi:hypothetical protein
VNPCATLFGLFIFIGSGSSELVHRFFGFAARMFSTEEAMIMTAGDGVRTGSGKTHIRFFSPIPEFDAKRKTAP